MQEGCGIGSAWSRSHISVQRKFFYNKFPRPGVVGKRFLGRIPYIGVVCRDAPRALFQDTVDPVYDIFEKAPAVFRTFRQDEGIERPPPVKHSFLVMRAVTHF